MDPMKSIQTCLRKFAVFSERTGRQEFWSFLIFGLLIVLSGLLSLIERFLSDLTLRLGVGDGLWEWMVRIGTLVIALPWISAALRRGHDAGYATWMVFCGLALSLPLLGISDGIAIALALEDQSGEFSSAVLSNLQVILLIAATAILAWLIYALSQPSQPGPNKYGPNPHEVTP